MGKVSLISLLPYISALLGLIIFVVYLKISRNKEKDYQPKTLGIAVRISQSLIMLGFFIRGYQEKMILTSKLKNDYLPTLDVFLIALLLFNILEFYSKYLYNKKYDEEKYNLNKELKKILF